MTETKHMRTVNDSVATTELLEDLTRSANKNTTEMLLLAAVEKVFVRDAGTGLLGGTDTVENDTDITLSTLVLDVSVVKGCDNVSSLILVTVSKKPTRGFGHCGAETQVNILVRN